MSAGYIFIVVSDGRKNINSIIVSVFPHISQQPLFRQNIKDIEIDQSIDRSAEEMSTGYKQLYITLNYLKQWNDNVIFHWSH